MYGMISETNWPHKLTAPNPRSVLLFYRQTPRTVYKYTFRLNMSRSKFICHFRIYSFTLYIKQVLLYIDVDNSIQNSSNRIWQKTRNISNNKKKRRYDAWLRLDRNAGALANIKKTHMLLNFSFPATPLFNAIFMKIAYTHIYLHLKHFNSTARTSPKLWWRWILAQPICIIFHLILHIFQCPAHALLIFNQSAAAAASSFPKCDWENFHFKRGTLWLYV